MLLLVVSYSTTTGVNHYVSRTYTCVYDTSSILYVVLDTWHYIRVTKTVHLLNDDTIILRVGAYYTCDKNGASFNHLNALYAACVVDTTPPALKEKKSCQLLGYTPTQNTGIMNIKHILQDITDTMNEDGVDPHRVYLTCSAFLEKLKEIDEGKALMN